MDREQELRNNARKFIIDALTEFSGKVPSKPVVEATVENIIKAFSGLHREQRSARAVAASQDE